MTLYETFRKSAEKEQEKTAIIVDDLKWSYSFRELLELVDKTAGCLYQYGVRPGMRVGILTTGTVEEASVFFSLNKIGAVARYLDFLKDTDYLVHSIEVSKLEILIIDEIFLPMEPAINPEEKPVIVITSKRFIRNGNCISLNCLFENGYTDVNPYPYDAQRVTTIINSSGSTGTPKPISLTDSAINAAAVKMLKADLINENSASSSEILTGALRDSADAVTVGVKSFGKGIIQMVSEVGENGAGYQMTIAEYYTPSGSPVHKIGITPDYEVPLPEGDNGMYDFADTVNILLI